MFGPTNRRCGSRQHGFTQRQESPSSRQRQNIRQAPSSAMEVGRRVSMMLGSGSGISDFGTPAVPAFPISPFHFEMHPY